MAHDATATYDYITNNHPAWDKRKETFE